jgi:integrase
LVAELGHAKYLVPPVRGVLGLLACRGLRCSDALRLRREDVANALETGVLSHVAKGGRRLEFRVLRTYKRYLEVLAGAFAEVPRASQVDQLVAPRAEPKGRRSAAAKSIARALVQLGVRAGVYGLHPHRLRRTYAVEYLRSMQGDPEALMKLTSHMQWAQMTTALEYVDYVRSEDLDAAAERAFGRPEGER